MHIWGWQIMWAVLVPITTHIPSFVTVAHIELWMLGFFVVSQSEQICKWGIKYVHLVTTDHMGSTCVHHYPHTCFMKIGHYVLLRKAKVYLFCWQATYIHHPSIHTYRQTAWQVKSKWSFQHSWWPTKTITDVNNTKLTLKNTSTPYARKNTSTTTISEAKQPLKNCTR